MYKDESERLAALACLDLAGEESTAFFQRVGRMAVRYFDFPTVMISFIDAEQEWFKTGVGFETDSLPRPVAFGEAVLAAGQAVFVEDMLENDRFFDHPLVVGAPNVRAYFSVPIISSSGHIVGTLSLIDYQPRRLTSDDLVFLEDLSAIIENELNRLSTCANYESVENQLLRYSERFKKSLNYANVGSWDWNLKTNDVFLTEQVSMILGYVEADMRVSYKSFLDSIHPADRKTVLFQIRDSIAQGSEFDIDFRIVKPDGEQRWVHAKGDVFVDETGEPERVLGVIVDIHERKKLEFDFLENELKFRNLYEDAPVGLALTNFKGRFLAANRAFLEMLGYSEAELKDLSYWDITPEGYSGQELRQLEQLGEHGQYGPYEKEYIRKDGSIVRVRLNGVLIQEPNDEPLIWSFIEDITHAKQAERAIQEAHNRLLEAQTLANMGSWQANMTTGELYWSETIYDIFGFDKEGFSPSVEAFKNAIHPEDVALVEQSEKKAEITGVHDVVHRIIRPDGEVRYVHELAQLVESESGKKDLLSGTVQDVTELKRVESSLRIFQRIFCASQQGMGITDKDGFLLYTNRAHDEIHGYEHGETVGMHITKFFSEENRGWIMDRVGRCIEQGEGWTGLLPIVQKNGKPVVTSANVNVIMDGQGRIENIFNIMSDYAPELERQNQLKQAKEAAEEASQAKSEFLSSMSHELRTPLNAVLGFTQILEFDDNLTQTQKDNLQEIMRAGNHLLALINDVLDLAKIESGNLEVSVEVVRLNELVEECLQLVSPMAEKKSIEVAYIEDTDIELKIDRVKLKQVFLNLLSNAIKYNHEGGSVRIEVELFDEDAFRILVSDTGVGVSEKDRSQLFQPFNRLGQERGPIEGTGVGLSITKTLVELMDGEIYHRPNKPRGSRFYIEFSQNKFYRGESLEDIRASATPQDAKPSQYEELTDFISTLHPPKVAPPEAIDEHNPRKRSRTILYIEDNEANIELVSKILSKRKSVKLLTASEALEGLELMKQCVPQLILLDIGLPDLDGYELLKTIKADLELKSIPVIATTAYASPGDIEEIYQAGFDGYIEKPHDIERFLMVIDQFLMIIDQFIEDE